MAGTVYRRAVSVRPNPTVRGMTLAGPDAMAKRRAPGHPVGAPTVLATPFKEVDDDETTPDVAQGSDPGPDPGVDDAPKRSRRRKAEDATAEGQA